MAIASALTELTSAKLLVVEGMDESRFFEALLSHVGIGGVQIRPLGGKDKFKTNLKALKLDAGFRNVKQLAITRDAEDSRDDTFRSITDSLRECDLPVPPTVGTYVDGSGISLGVFIVPGVAQRGMLEDLCLATVKEHPVLPHVHKFFESLHAVLTKRDPPNAELIDGMHYYPSNEAKAKAQAFLSGMHKIVNTVGNRAQKKYWNFNHTVLDDLKAFLQRLR